MLVYSFFYQNFDMRSYYYLLFLCLALAWSPSVSATHLAAGDLTYQCLGNGQYEFTLRLFRDCNGIPLTRWADINVQPTGNCQGQPPLNFTLIEHSRRIIPTVCTALQGNQLCQNGSLSTYQEVIYKGIQDLSSISSSCGWVAEFSNCCRNVAITNLAVNPNNTYFVIQAEKVVPSTVPPGYNLCNNAPVVNSTPVFVVCDSTWQNISNIMFDVDGDSIVYQLDTPRTRSNLPVYYRPGYSTQQPLNTDSSGFQFDPSNGTTNFTPNGQEITVVDILALEYRQGVLIGRSRRSLQIAVVTCQSNDHSPTLDQVERYDNGVWQSQGTQTSFEACVGETVRFRVSFSDADPNDSLWLSQTYSSLLSSYPNASIQPSYGASTNRLLLDITLPSIQFNNITIGVMDNACPIAHLQTFGFHLVPATHCVPLSGRAALDQLANCMVDPSEPAYANHTLTFIKGSRAIQIPINGTGQYQTYIDTGQYQLHMTTNSHYHRLCASAASVQVVPSTGLVHHLPIESLQPCPLPSIDIGTPALVHCRDNRYAVRYCNLGVMPLNNIYATVTLDPLFVIDSTTHPIDSQSGQWLRFALGNLAVGQCSTFYILGRLDTACNLALVGQTYCAEASITADSVCAVSGADLYVEGTCTGDSVLFRIQNRGLQTMNAPASYTIFQNNAIIAYSSALALAPNASTPWFGYPADGSTYRVEIPQDANHPWSVTASRTVAGCVDSNNIIPFNNLVNIFSLNDTEPFYAIDCQPSLAAYDPNDKQGFPKGYGLDHYIQRGTSLEYRIRFQNTGTYYAQDVVILDTLSQYVNVQTVRPNVASHAYTWTLIDGHILEFTFNNINLPDSGRDLAGSQGFVDYRIELQPNLPLQTRIENQAAIYFDFNPPIFTNTTWHTINENFVRFVGLPTIAQQDETVVVKAFPNPFSQSTTIQVERAQPYESLRLEVYNAMGQLVEQVQAPSGAQAVVLQRQRLPVGLYFYKLIADDALLHTGQLVAQ